MSRQQAFAYITKQGVGGALLQLVSPRTDFTWEEGVWVNMLSNSVTSRGEGSKDLRPHVKPIPSPEMYADLLTDTNPPSYPIMRTYNLMLSVVPLGAGL